MHVAIFVDFHPSTLGGTQTSVVGQRHGLEAQGHKVTLVCPRPISGPLSSDASMIELPSIPLLRFVGGAPIVAPSRRNARYIEQMLRKLPPIDIVHTQTTGGVAVLGARLAQKYQLPRVQTMHGRDDMYIEKLSPFPQVFSWIASWLHQRVVPHTVSINADGLSDTSRRMWAIMVNQAQSADHVVVPSHHFREKLIQRGLTRDVTVISNGLDATLLGTLPRPAVRVLGKGAPLRLMWTSRLSPEKRPLVGIKALLEVKNCHLDLYGSGECEEEVKKFIKDHHLSRIVTVRGQVTQKQVLKAMLEHDVLLYSSYGFETQGMVLLEAVAAGLPVIYADPELKETLPPGGAVLTETPKSSSFTQAISTLQKHPERIKSMSQAMIDARSTVEQATHTKAMIRLYKALIKSKKPR